MLFISITHDERHQGLFKNVTKDVADITTIKTKQNKKKKASSQQTSPNILHVVIRMLNRTGNVRIT